MLAPWPTHRSQRWSASRSSPNLDKKDLKAMSREMSERTFPQGADVTVTGHTGVGFFVIDEGRATRARRRPRRSRRSGPATTSARWR